MVIVAGGNPRSPALGDSPLDDHAKLIQKKIMCNALYYRLRQAPT